MPHTTAMAVTLFDTRSGDYSTASIPNVNKPAVQSLRAQGLVIKSVSKIKKG